MTARRRSAMVYITKYDDPQGFGAGRRRSHIPNITGNDV
jgi:hypothetical protein